MSILGQQTATGDPVDNAAPASVSGGIVPFASQAADAVSAPQQPTTQNATPTPAPAQGGSRLARIMQAVANVASTAVAGIPDKGRPSFATGLGEGARAEQQAIANQQAIKFRDLDSQVRPAQLHNQDLKLQQDTQAQQDAHVKAELDNRALAESMGIDYDTLPSHGPTVMAHAHPENTIRIRFLRQDVAFVDVESVSGGGTNSAGAAIPLRRDPFFLVFTKVDGRWGVAVERMGARLK